MKGSVEGIPLERAGVDVATVSAMSGEGRVGITGALLARGMG